MFKNYLQFAVRLLAPAGLHMAKLRSIKQSVAKDSYWLHCARCKAHLPMSAVHGKEIDGFVTPTAQARPIPDSRAP
jgi:hypothetical protein